MSDKDDRVLLACPVCETMTFGESEKALKDMQDGHNEQQHDGDRVARRVARKPAHINVFSSHVEKRHGEDVRRRTMTMIVRNDTDWLLTGEKEQ